ncbi:hypothetical protein MRX96_037765 [Rhipicephalus microplus]
MYVLNPRVAATHHVVAAKHGHRLVGCVPNGLTGDPSPAFGFAIITRLSGTVRGNGSRGAVNHRDARSRLRVRRPDFVTSQIVFVGEDRNASTMR